jgi:GTP-binding protein Era
MTNVKHCGYVALVGRPNVGKSTLLNHILGKKLSITSRKPQTTRHKVLGILTQGDTQTIFVDTPGLLKALPRKINRYMNKAAFSAIKDVDVICFVIDGIHFNDGDQWVLDQLKTVKVPVILVINKMDTVTDKDFLFERVAALTQDFSFKSVVPVSATVGTQLDVLLDEIKACLPETDFFFFPEDTLTDKDDRFQASEIIREKLMRATSQELPYETHVVIDEMRKEPSIIHMHATIYVARDSQKGIIIGAGGEMLKKIGTQARLDMEARFNTKVMLKLFVKVKDKWSDSDQLIQNYGYDNE